MLICIDDFIICPFISLYFIVRPQAKVHSFNIPYMVWKPRKYITTSNSILYDSITDILHFYKITSSNLYSVYPLQMFITEITEILFLSHKYLVEVKSFVRGVFSDSKCFTICFKDSNFWQSDILVCHHGSSFCITH